MPRLIWVFAGRTVTLLVLSRCGSFDFSFSVHLTIIKGYFRITNERYFSFGTKFCVKSFHCCDVYNEAACHCRCLSCSFLRVWLSSTIIILLCTIHQLVVLHLLTCVLSQQWEGNKLLFNYELKFDFLTFIRWWSQRAELKFHEVQSASCRILVMTTGFITRWTSKNQILTHIYALFLDHFCAQTVVVRWNLSKLCSSEKLLTNVFGHYVIQPTSWLDVDRTLRWPIETFVDPWLSLTAVSHDQLTFIGVWSQLVWNGSSKESQRQV